MSYSDSVDLSDSLLKIKSDNYFKNLGAITEWDTLYYTYKLQELFKENPLVGAKGNIIDIFKKGDNYIIRLRAYTKSYNTAYVIDFSLDSLSFSRYKQMFLNTNNDLFIVVKSTDINTYSPQLVAEAEGDDEGGCDAYLRLNTRRRLIKIDGILTDCSTLKNSADE